MSNLTGITIPDEVTSIKSYAFDRCTALKEVNISENSKLSKFVTRRFGVVKNFQKYTFLLELFISAVILLLLVQHLKKLQF